MQPSKSLHFRGEISTGENILKLEFLFSLELTVMVLKKHIFLVIGESRKPICFEEVKSFPAICEANTKAWMTKNIFEKYFRELDERFIYEKCKVLLFLDNCAVHTSHIP